MSTWKVITETKGRETVKTRRDHLVVTAPGPHLAIKFAQEDPKWPTGVGRVLVTSVIFNNMSTSTRFELPGYKQSWRVWFTWQEKILGEVTRKEYFINPVARGNTDTVAGVWQAFTMTYGSSHALEVVSVERWSDGEGFLGDEEVDRMADRAMANAPAPDCPGCYDF
jgi:hypothetical protein